MDAPCKIQGSIHVFRLVNNMCPGKWVHITPTSLSKPFYFRGWYDLTYENLRKRKLHFVETLF